MTTALISNGGEGVLREHEAYFRFYEELNDFLPPDKLKRSFPYRFNGNPSIKDAIEAIGVPHPEVEMILVNGASVGFEYHLRNYDRVSVYPVFETIDVSPLLKIREKPLRRNAFVLDVHLGKLARMLRMLGFDALYGNDYKDREIIDLAVKEQRVVLTRDRRLLRVKVITHGYWVRSTDPETQAREALRRFDLSSQIKPFHRCMVCNGEIIAIEKSAVLNQLEPLTVRYYDEFYRCVDCNKIYWRGSHYQRMIDRIDRLKANS